MSTDPYYDPRATHHKEPQPRRAFIEPANGVDQWQPGGPVPGHPYPGAGRDQQRPGRAAHQPPAARTDHPVHPRRLGAGVADHLARPRVPVIAMSILRKHEHPVVSILFEIAAWVAVILFGLTVAAIVDLVLTAAGWSR